MTTGSTHVATFEANVEQAKAAIESLSASGSGLQRVYESINPTFRRLSTSMQGVVNRSVFVQDALQTLGEIKGIPAIEKQLEGVNKQIDKIGSRRTLAEAKQATITPGTPAYEAADVKISGLARESQLLTERRIALEAELSARKKLSLTDSQRAAIALNQEAQSLRDITIEGPQTAATLDAVNGRLEVIYATLQSAGGKRLAKSLAPHIEELKQYSATLKANEQDVKATLSGRGQAIVDLDRQFTQSTGEVGVTLNQMDATVKNTAQVLLGMSSQLIGTARSSALYATANEMVRTSQQGLLTEEQRGILALEALGLKMRQMATGEAPLAAGAVQRLATSIAQLEQSVPGVNNQLAGMAPVLREQGKILKETEIQASRTAGSFNFMGDVSPKVQQGMRAMSAASQGFMLSTSLLQRNLTGVAFSLIFMQFSGVLKLSAAFAGLTLAGGLAIQTLSKIWKQKQEAKALGDAMFVVTGATDAYTRSVEVAEKITKELGLEGKLQTRVSDGLAKAFASMRIQGLEPTIESAKEFIDFFLLMEASTKGGIQDIDQFISEFLQFKKDGGGALASITRGSNDVANALFVLQKQAGELTTLTTEQIKMLAKVFEQEYGVVLPEAVLASITSVQQFAVAYSDAMLAAGKVPPPVHIIQEFAQEWWKASVGISGIMANLQQDLDKRWEGIISGTTAAGQAFGQLATDAGTAKENINKTVTEAASYVGKLKEVRDSVANAAWPANMQEQKEKILAYYDDVIERAKRYLEYLLAIVAAQSGGSRQESPAGGETAAGEAPGRGQKPPEEKKEEEKKEEKKEEEKKDTKPAKGSPGGEIDEGSAGWGGYQQAGTNSGAKSVTVNVTVDVHDNNVGSKGQSDKLAQEIEDAVISGINRGVKTSGMPVIQ